MSAISLEAELIDRVRAEFLEMPGLLLTSRQARRLWGLDEETCACLLNILLASGFLVRWDDEQYGRAFDGEPLRARIDATPDVGPIFRSGMGSRSRERQPHGHDRPTC